MRTIARWLNVELLRIHRLRLRVFHGIGLLILGAILVLVFAVGIFVGYHYPYRTLPPPKAPGQTAPNCGTNPANHVAGACLPRPKTENQASITATTQGPDLSNNDPVYNGQGAIAAHNAFEVFKVSEGTGYVDPTAAPMAARAKSFGLVVGGYDFLHVCGSDAAGEANVFTYHLKADGLTGPKTLPPFADAEYGGAGCNARAWLQTWVDSVYRSTGRHPWVYTGAWWWQPHMGAYWPANAGAWISGYGVRYPYMPSGRSQLDMWQFTSSGWNGASTGDLSTWRDGVAAFAYYTGGTAPTPTSGRYAIYPVQRFNLGHAVKASERNTIRVWDQHKCRTPARRPVCKSTYLHLQLERDRVYFLAHHHLVRGRWVALSRPRWGAPSKQQPFGARYAGISRRLR